MLGSFASKRSDQQGRLRRHVGEPSDTIRRAPDRNIRVKIWYIIKELISEIPWQVSSVLHQRRNDLVTVLTKSSVKLQ